MRYFLASFAVLLGICLFVEKTARFTTASSVFTPERIQVNYRWVPQEPLVVSDPVNVGVNRKWFGLKRYDASVILPSYQARNWGNIIDPDAIETVAPVKGALYTCENRFYSVVCEGPFRYRVNPHRVFFEAGGHLISPPEDWLTDIRTGTLTVWKYF